MATIESISDQIHDLNLFLSTNLLTKDDFSKTINEQLSKKINIIDDNITNLVRSVDENAIAIKKYNELIVSCHATVNSLIHDIKNEGEVFLQKYVKERANLAYIGAEFGDFADHLKSLYEKQQEFLQIYNNLMSILSVLSELSSGVRGNIEIFLEEKDKFLGVGRHKLVLVRDCAVILSAFTFIIFLCSKFLNFKRKNK